MTITAAGAAGAYDAAQRLVQSIASEQATAGVAPTDDQSAGAASGALNPGGFGELLGQAVTGTLETGRAAEAKALSMAEGKASIVDVVTAVAETEVAVETLVTVRDKVISAYKDVMNMPI